VLSLLHQQGLDATGEVTVRSPVGATEAAVAADRYDGVVVIDRPGNFTSRIRLDLPSRIERRVTEPVLTIKA
jgi:hypothetical protein